MENLPGLMEDATKDNGKMVSKMGKEYIVIKKEWSVQVYGPMARKLNGLIDMI